MSVSLRKSEKVSLKKSDGSDIKEVIVALGWEKINSMERYNEPGLKGLLKVALGLVGSPDMDCDASCICEKNGKVSDKTLVYFNSPSYKKAIKHSGDDLIGGKGDREQIVIKTDLLDDDIDKIYVFVNIYNCSQRHQNFGMVESAYVRIVDSSTGEEFCRYDLVDDYSDKTGIIVGQLLKDSKGKWEFYADGEGLNVRNIKEIVNILKEK